MNNIGQTLTEWFPMSLAHVNLLCLIEHHVHVLVKALQVTTLRRGQGTSLPSHPAYKGGSYDNSAFYPHVCLVKQPDLHFLPALEKSENKILRGHTGISPAQVS